MLLGHLRHEQGCSYKPGQHHTSAECIVCLICAPCFCRVVVQERAELRRRAQLEEEASAARRNKVTVTLDLLGRKVVVADAPDGPAAGAAGSSGSSFQLGAESATQQLLQQVQAAAAQEHIGGSKQEGGSGGAAAAGSHQSKVRAVWGSMVRMPG